MAIKLLNLSNQETEDTKYNAKINKIKNKDIAIIGMSCKFPGSKNLHEFWNNIRNGMDLIGELPKGRKRDTDKLAELMDIDSKTLKYYNAAYLDSIDKFDYKYFNIPLKEANNMDPHHRLFLETAYQALDDAGYGGKRIIGSRTGIYLGFSGDNLIYKQAVYKCDPSSLLLSLTGNISAMIASRIAYQLDLRGPCLLVNTTCSSSLVAVHMACQALKNGECEMAIVGSSKLDLLPIESKDLIDVQVNSSDYRSYSFDDSSDGIGVGEGVAAIVIKPLYKAVQDMDNIYAVIKGSAINHDGTTVGITAPSSIAQSDVLERAWKDADINPEKLRYIEAHGTGTKLGDPIELDAITRSFEKYTDLKQHCAIGSVKTNIGHLGDCAGIAGLIKAVLSLENAEIPPNINFNRPNRKIDFLNSPVYVNIKPRSWNTDKNDLRICGVSSFGISGTNCHVVLEEAPAKVRYDGDKSKKKHIFTLSAKEEDVLKVLINEYFKFLSKNESDINEICYTVNTGRTHLKYRLAIIARNIEDLRSKLYMVLKSDDLRELKADEVFFGDISEDINEELDSKALKKTSLFSDTFNEDLLEDICRLYIEGAQVDWERIYYREKIYKVSLPVYPFKPDRCWLEIKGDAISRQVVLKGKDSSDYTQAERRIAEAWAEVLGLEEINIYDNFFELGGDSISGVKVVSKLQDEYEISMNNIFDYSNVHNLAEHINAKKESLKLKIDLYKKMLSNNRDNNISDIELEKYKENYKAYRNTDINKRKFYKNILITGATGYLGMYIMNDLLINTESNLYLLIRSKSINEAWMRIKEKYNFYFSSNDLEKYKTRIVIVNGDITKEYLGFDQSLYRNLSETIDCIIHSAALVKHYGKYEDFYSINFQGTKNMIDFACNIRLKDFNHISTPGIAFGNVKGKDVVLFTEFDQDIGQNIDNFYIRTKLIAEKFVSDSRKKGINAKIFRVGNIVFNSQNGSFQENIGDNSIYMQLKTMLKLGFMPELKNNLELSFVDYVSKAIVLLFDRIELKNETFHIYNNNFINIVKIGEVFRENGFDIKFVEPSEYLDLIYKIYTASKDDTLKLYIENMFLNMGIYDEDTRTTECIVASEKTVLLLESLGFKWPEIESTHIDKMIKYCIKINFFN